MTRYLTCAETAVLVRKALKAKFPDVKFSVRSDTYSGGASIRVTWLLGPTTKQVEAVAKQFQGGDFDGMIDLKIHNESWLLPDGTARLAESPGTEGSRGVIPAFVSDAPHPNAELVSFGADFVFCDRTYGNEENLVERVARDMCQLNGKDWQGINGPGLFGQGDYEPVSTHAWRLLQETAFANGERYAGVRWATAEERESSNVIMAIVKTAA